MIRTDPRNPKGIAWLASYPKSGNTWLRMFLYQLTRIMSGFPRETDEINRLERSSTYETRLVDLFDRFLGKPLATATFLEMMRARSRVQAAIAARGAKTTLVKTHNLLGLVKDMPTINVAVSVGAVYVIRDPRDVAPSLSRHLGFTVDRAIEVMNTRTYATGNSSEGAGEIWGSRSEHVLSWTGDPDSGVLVIRYEDMLAKPTETFSAVARHLRLTPTPQQIASAIEMSSFDHLQRQEQKIGFVERSERSERFFAAGKAGTWQETLTPGQVKSIVDAHRAQMARFGYRS